MVVAGGAVVVVVVVVVVDVGATVVVVVVVAVVVGATVVDVGGATVVVGAAVVASVALVVEVVMVSGASAGTAVVLEVSPPQAATVSIIAIASRWLLFIPRLLTVHGSYQKLVTCQAPRIVATDTLRIMEVADCLRLFSAARVARLATVGPTGPHLVPIVFAVHDDAIVTAVDHKPKRSRNLRRLANIADNPAVTLLVDEYDEDWGRLWWVRADGVARVLDEVTAMQPALDLLAGRYEQYRKVRPAGPVIEVRVQQWTGWSAR